LWCSTRSPINLHLLTVHCSLSEFVQIVDPVNCSFLAPRMTKLHGSCMCTLYLPVNPWLFERRG
jgi:hypothetical protein